MDKRNEEGDGDGRTIQGDGSQNSTSEPKENILADRGSLPERIKASATGLLRGSILQLHPGTVLPELAASLPCADKSGSSSSSAGSVYSNEASASRPTSTASTQSFRSMRQPEPCEATNDFDAFCKGSTASPLAIPNELTSLHDDGRLNRGIDANAQRLDAPALHPLPDRDGISIVDQLRTDNVRSQTRYATGLDTAFSEPSYGYDGSEVVSLLSDPTFCTDDIPTESVSRPTSTDTRSHEQSSAAHSDTEKLRVDGFNGLELIPGLKHTPATIQQVADEMPLINESEQDISVRPWLDILNRYHDEVWGDMLPLVRQARVELQADNVNEQGLREKPAIRRLHMLLGHLQKQHRP